MNLAVSTPPSPLQPDAGPLAWIIEQVRDNLLSAQAAVRKHLQLRLLSEADETQPTAGNLLQARHQVHQAAGAIDLLGYFAAARLALAAERALTRFIDQPDGFDAAAQATLESGLHALLDYLDAQRSGKQEPALKLFRQYRELMDLGGGEAPHPADLWDFDWTWPQLDDAETSVPALQASDRADYERALLDVLRVRDVSHAAASMQAVARRAQAAAEGNERALWWMAGGLFEAMAQGLLPADIYVKRLCNRLNLQLKGLLAGQPQPSQRLAHELLFFCDQALARAHEQQAVTPTLHAIQAHMRLVVTPWVDYQRAYFGLVDPALIQQARKRISQVKDGWSQLSGADFSRIGKLVESTLQLAQTLREVAPGSETLAAAIERMVRAAAENRQLLTPERVLEVATALLFLEASFTHFQSDDPLFLQRATELAQRLERSAEGASAGNFAPWMEELYRQSSETQTLGSVVQELRHDMSTVERLLDAYFRDPATQPELAPVPKLLSQMRGVLSVLGLDLGAQALSHIRQSVDDLINDPPDEAKAREPGGVFDRLASNIGTLGFLIDMLGYQPELAKSLFSFDPHTGELRPIVPSTPRTAPPSTRQDLQHQAERLASAMEQGLDIDQAAGQLDRLRIEAALAQESDLSAQVVQARALLGTEHDAGAAARLLRESFTAPADKALEASPVPPAPHTPSPESAKPAPISAAQPDDAEDDELLDIFLEEAAEVIAAGHAGVAQLAADPADADALTSVRRAFHTLKGSSRMVGLTDFGEAAWALEQVFNQILAEQHPASPAVLDLAARAFKDLEAWTSALHAGDASQHDSAVLCAAARALRGLPPIEAPAAPKPVAAAAAPEPAAPVATAPESPLHEPDFVDTWATDLPPDALDSSAASAPIAMERADAETAETLDWSVPTAPAPSEPADAPVHIELEMPPLDVTALDLPAASLLDLDSTPRSEQDSTPELGTPFGELTTPSSVAAKSAVTTEPPQAASDAAPVEIVSDAGAVEFQELDARAFDQFFLDAGADEAAGVLPETPHPQATDPSTLPHETPGAAFPEPPEHLEIPALAQVYTLDVHRPSQPTPDENIKVVGDLRIPIPLYNIYLNEADELVRRLGADISAWSLQPGSPITEEVPSLAHQLRGSSRTVGLQTVGQLAELLEEALHLQRENPANIEPQDIGLLVEASEDIRRLLHQFAAGFLRPAQRDLTDALQSLVHRLQHHSARAGVKSSVDLDQAPLVTGLNPDGATEPESAAPAPVQTPEMQDATQSSSGLAEPHASFAPAAAAAPSLSQDAATADPTLRDSIDPELFPIFEEEAAELLPGLSAALRQWETRPRDTAAPKQAMRLLHTIKGSARMAGAMALGDQAHSLESDIESLLASDAESPREQDFIDLIARHDALNTRFERLREASSRGETELGDLHIEQGLQEEEARAAAVADQATKTQEHTPGAVEPRAEASAGTPAPQPLTLAPATGAASRVASQPVRVRAALLDRLVNQVGEVSIARARLENEFGLIRSSTSDLGDNLDRLRAQVRDIELQADAQMAARAQAAREDGRDFDPLEFDRFTRFQELTRMMAESVNDLALVQTTLSRTLQSTDDNLARQGRLTRELQRDLLRTRMVEFDSISERLYRTVRQAGKDAGIPVRLDIEGGTIEIDRGVLDRMAGTFEHILRNAVAHGLESPAVREAAGKPATGTITLKLRQEGSEVVVSIADDGAGLDYAAIERKARSTGLLGPADQADEALLRDLIFRPGFSSKEQATEMAGRGVGLDVVRTDTRALGGRVELASVPGQGTTFTLVLPLTTAVTQVVLLRAGSKVYAAPASLVDLVLRLKPAQVAAAAQQGVLEHAGSSLPFYWLGALTAESGASSETPGRTIPVVLIRSAAQRLALQVDEVLGNQEVVVKNLGPQLSRVPGLAGISVLPTGNLVLIYNPVALAAVYGEEATQRMVRAAEQSQAAQSAALPHAPQTAMQEPPHSLTAGNTVLVVDDSITVRRVTQRFLTRNGYAVLLAKDGLDALEQLQSALPDVVLTDIEMPRMDGFDLTRNIRADDRTRHLPVIMITSRIADKHRNYARELGVNHYLGKPYSEDELLGLIKSYMTSGQLH